MTAVTDADVREANSRLMNEVLYTRAGWFGDRAPGDMAPDVRNRAKKAKAARKGYARRHKRAR